VNTFVSLYNHTPQHRHPEPVLANVCVFSTNGCSKKGVFPMCVPSLSWQKDRLYIYWLKKGRRRFRTW
jgi:hypothetical protein